MRQVAGEGAGRRRAWGPRRAVGTPARVGTPVRSPPQARPPPELWRPRRVRLSAQLRTLDRAAAEPLSLHRTGLFLRSWLFLVAPFPEFYGSGLSGRFKKKSSQMAVELGALAFSSLQVPRDSAWEGECLCLCVCPSDRQTPARVVTLAVSLLGYQETWLTTSCTGATPLSAGVFPPVGICFRFRVSLGQKQELLPEVALEVVGRWQLLPRGQHSGGW